MRKETDWGCLKCKKGIAIRVDASRLEDAMGHRVYKCDNCGQKHKYTPEHDDTPILIGDQP